MDAEGPAVAKKYYEKYGVTFPSLVDPNHATGFGYVPWTFFVDEHGVVRGKGKNWKELATSAKPLKPVTPEVLEQWSDSKKRLSPEAIAQLEQKLAKDPHSLSLITDLTSRYLSVGREADAKLILRLVAGAKDAREVAREGSREEKELLSSAYLQLSRAEQGDRDASLKAARMAYFLKPSIGLAKQISRIADPAKFDDRPGGKFDNAYREGYARQIKADRAAWLEESKE